MVTVVSHSRNDTELLGKRLGGTLGGGEVIAFFGGLGMGKTVMTSGIALGMGLDAKISSPTFALVHEHYNADAKAAALCHFDMYRVSGFDDLASTGFFDYLDNGSVLCIEWSENIREFLPQDCIKIEIQRGDTDDDRILTLTGDKKYEAAWN